MPLYEYECKKCGHRFERIQSFSAEPVKECPVCKGEVEKLISAPAIQFKGSGFYSTDYASKPAKSGANSDGASKPESPASQPASGEPASGGAASSTAKTSAKADAPSAPASKSKE